MRPFNTNYTDINFHLKNLRKPDFNNVIKVLRKVKPDRPTLLEFFIGANTFSKFVDSSKYDFEDRVSYIKFMTEGYRCAGYDYVCTYGSDMRFDTGPKGKDGRATISLNEGTVIWDRSSFENYSWPDPDSYDYSILDKISGFLPEGMKVIVCGPGGVLENVIALVGYDNLCFMLADDPDLVQDIFDAVGSRLLRYYEISAAYESVGALVSNDDWGFNTQTMLSVEDMRKYVFPWHKKIVEAIHSYSKPVILHSCGNLSKVMDDIIDDLKFDCKHSYEDNILPVEEAYEKYVGRIAIAGGIDIDFLCRSTPQEVYDRATAMLDRASSRGGYGLGSGNSIPYYIPTENYLALLAAAMHY
jgi:uroporphyrinogen decarboxylase